MKNLECSSAGDKRFSALYAEVEVNGVLDTIERHYQSVKRKGEPCNPKPCRKGERVEFIIISNKILPPKFLTPFYKLLWVKYLDAHPELVEYAKEFDTFSDKFKGKSINCQADVITQYIKEGRKSILLEPLVIEFIKLLKEELK